MDETTIFGGAALVFGTHGLYQNNPFMAGVGTVFAIIYAYAVYRKITQKTEEDTN